jgi:hypothetical protein
MTMSTLVTSRAASVASLGLISLVMGSGASAQDLTRAMTFVGITPCRVIDTRGGTFSGQAGPPALVAGATRTFQITGTVPGLPTQCGIPSNASAVSINFTATGFAGAGDIRVFPAGGAVPNASILNYRLENIANATSVPLGPVPSTTERGITVQADVSATHLVADVNGYYVAETVFAAGHIREDASIRNASSRVASVLHPGTGLYCVTFTTQPTQVQLETSVVGLAGGGSAALFARVTNGQAGGAGCAFGQLDIKIVNTSGVNTNGRFSFIVP